MSFSITGRPQLAAPAARMQRRMRRPEHRAYLHFTPMVITPFMAAPVVPGETLKNLLWQARVITTPTTSNVLGWWLEYYFFYVKHRHMGGTIGSDHLAMMLDLEYSLAAGSLHTADAAAFNAKIDDTRIVERSYEAIVREFFRGEGESDADGLADAGNLLNYARVRMPGWWDSILPDTSLTTLHGAASADSIGGTDLDQVGELGRALETWRTLREMGVTNMEYDDWLRSFGVRIAAPQEDRPELIRYTKEWQYPSNAVSVDSTAQRVSSVLSWSITERADKDRYFKEPGIILGCVIARPKWYHDRQQAGVGQLKSALGWMTPFATGQYDPYLPAGGVSGHSFDSRDLYNHGDQWLYASRGTLPTSMIAFPTSDGVFAYPTSTAINALFTDGSNGFVKMDAVVNLAVASGAVASDHTPRTVT